MVGIDDLAMLDLQLWLRSGEAAATRLHCAQSTISRRNGETLRCFDLTMVRDAGEWQLQGDQTLLQMERGVHQLHRMRGGHCQVTTPRTHCKIAVPEAVWWMGAHTS